MKQKFWDAFYKFLAFSAGALFFLTAVAYFLFSEAIVAAISAYLLSFLFTCSNFYVVSKIKEGNAERFYRQFLVSLALRFVAVIIILVVVLGTIKIHQISFTVSFIISYIFHSVIEMISINNILETDN